MMMRAGTWLSVASLVLTFGACDDETVSPVSAQPDAGFLDVPLATPDTTTAPRDTSTSTDTATAELPVTQVGQCVGTPGNKPIMSACLAHCECVTGFCYDEGFLGSGFSFCSMDCENTTGTSCSSQPHPTRPGIQKYGCMNLTSLKVDHNLTVTKLCALRCETVEECQQYSSKYDMCGTSTNWTTWEGHTIAGFGTCLISSEIIP